MITLYVKILKHDLCKDISFVHLCFILTGKKVSGKVPPKERNLKLLTEFENRKFVPNQEFVDKINNAQSTWKAVVCEEYSGMTVAQLISRAGGPKKLNFPKPRSVTTCYNHFFT